MALSWLAFETLQWEEQFKGRSEIKVRLEFPIGRGPDGGDDDGRARRRRNRTRVKIEFGVANEITRGNRGDGGSLGGRRSFH